MDHFLGQPFAILYVYVTSLLSGE